MKKILLLNPPGRLPYTRDYFCSKVAKVNYVEHPVDLLVLSGILHKKYTVHLLDGIAQNLSFEKAARLILDLDIEAIIFLSGTTSWIDDFSFLERIKKEKPHLKLIGLGDIFREEEVFKNNTWIDAIILDFTTEDILNYLDDNFAAIKNMLVRNNKNDILIKKEKSFNEFEIPIPRHELFLKYQYTFPFARQLPFATMLTDYGCPFNCSFCIYGTLGYKFRKLENVFLELDYLASLKIKELFIKDQSFGANKKRAMVLCAQMAKKYNFSWTCFLRPDLADIEVLSLMQEAGCHTIMFGIESASDEILKKYKPGINKKNIAEAFSLCQKLKINTVGIFILGFPEDDEESCQKTIDFSLKLGCDFASFNLFVPKLHTPARQALLKDNLIQNEQKVMDQSGIASIYNSQGLSAEKLHRLHKRAIRRFYLRPNYILKKFICIHSANQLKMFANSAFCLFKEAFKR